MFQTSIFAGMYLQCLGVYISDCYEPYRSNTIYGTGVFLPTFTYQKESDIRVSKYTSPMVSFGPQLFCYVENDSETFILSYLEDHPS